MLVELMDDEGIVPGDFVTFGTGDRCGVVVGVDNDASKAYILWSDDRPVFGKALTTCLVKVNQQEKKG